jgi:uncharacterized protein (TIGR02145 family)
MKIVIPKLFLLLLVILCLVVLYTCKKEKEKEKVPTLTTTTVSLVSKATATGGGNISNEGGDSVINRGVCWSTSANPTIELATMTSDGPGTGDFTSSLTGLSTNTLYYVKAYATNNFGTAYGPEVNFYTYYGKQTGTVIDVDGNIYNAITIVTQTWIKEDLRTTRYNDGTTIPLVTENTAWADLTTPGYCWNHNATATSNIFYNWYSVNTGKLCPTGWHVPTSAEWTTLTDYVGEDAGKKLKATTGWRLITGTNETNFTAYGGDSRDSYGRYSIINYMYGFWWSSTDYSSDVAIGRSIGYLQNGVSLALESKKCGFSVRCLKD